MSLMGFFASPFWGFAGLVLAIILAVVVAWQSYDRNWGRAGASLVGVILCVWVMVIGLTMTVVPYNYKAIVQDTTTGTMNGGVREAGLISKPLLGSEVYQFPSSTAQALCGSFTPSVVGGYEVKLDLCFYVDLSRADWVKQVKKYNAWKFDELKNIWISQVAPLVAQTASKFSPQDITNDRAKVASQIQEGTAPFFASEDMSLVRITLNNWDFTNKAVAEAWDSTVVAQTAQLRADAELKAAETRIKAMQVLATGQAVTLKSLGITGEQATVDWLYLQWLTNQNITNPIVVVGSGAGASPIVGVPQAQPAPVQK